MAHNLNSFTDSNGAQRSAFYSVRESAWHGLGQVVERPVSDLEALKLAGLDWKVHLEPVLRQDMSPLESHVATVRSDTKETLGVVGSGFTPVQNYELFDWLRGLDGYADVTIETAGALGRGETVWAMGRCDGLKLDLGDGGIQPYLLISNGHAGNRRVHIMPTTVRVVCQNTLRMAETSKKRKLVNNTTDLKVPLNSGFALRHTANVQDALKRVRDAYAATTDAWKTTEEALRFLHSKQYTAASLKRLVTETFDLPPKEEMVNEDVARALADESDRAAVIREERTKRIMEILASSTCSAPKIAGTLYSALQAVTEFIEHELPVSVRSVERVGNESKVEAKTRAIDLRRLTSTNFGGPGDALKEAAWDLAMDLATSA